MYSPGEICPQSGIYEPVGPRGGATGGMQIALSKGDRFPPAGEAGNLWKLVRATTR